MAKKEDRSEDVLTALRHPLRRKILKQLIGKDDAALSPREVSEELDTPLSNVSYHVRVLVDCRALKLVRTKAVRGSIQHFYKPSPAFVAEPTVAMLLGLSK